MCLNTVDYKFSLLPFAHQCKLYLYMYTSANYTSPVCCYIAIMHILSLLIASLRTLQEEVYRHANCWLDALPTFARVSVKAKKFWLVVSLSVPSPPLPLFLPLPLGSLQLLITQNVCSPPPPIEPTPENCPNGPSWLWWFVSAVPTTTERKMEFLRSTSLRERLVMLRDILPLPTRQ